VVVVFADEAFVIVTIVVPAQGPNPCCS